MKAKHIKRFENIATYLKVYFYDFFLKEKKSKYLFKFKIKKMNN